MKLRHVRRVEIVHVLPVRVELFLQRELLLVRRVRRHVQLDNMKVRRVRRLQIVYVLTVRRELILQRMLLVVRSVRQELIRLLQDYRRVQCVLDFFIRRLEQEARVRASVHN